jgi:hypothetical protein
MLLRALEKVVGTRPALTVLHMVADAAIPAFEDQPGLALEARERAFRRRTGARHGQVKLRFATGSAADVIIATTEESGADLIVMAWGQNLSPVRAKVVQAVLERSTRYLGWRKLMQMSQVFESGAKSRRAGAKPR